MDDEKYLIFLPCCILTKGYNRTAIYDTQRELIEFVPNDLFDFFQCCNKKSINYISDKYSGDDKKIVDEYIHFLIENEYAIIGSEHDTFHISQLPMIKNDYAIITNCVCEYSSFLHDHLTDIVYILDELLSCSAFQLISWDNIPFPDLQNVLEKFNDTGNIFHLEILMKYGEEYEIDKLKLLLKKFFLINRIIIHSSPYDFQNICDHTAMIYTKQNINKNSSCGIINKSYFSLNLQHITESIHHNTCLNKKLFINKDGNISNCPFTSKIYGNILDNNIISIIKDYSYQRLWNINKDKIKVCQDCEFRYICSDCRIFIKDIKDMYSQPLNCNYNPYISKWEGEKDYYPVEVYTKK